jgi:GxxExxY protein
MEKGKDFDAKSLNELSSKIIGACIEIHRELGPGLLESAYEQCLCYELTQMGLMFSRQADVPLRYKGVILDCGYRIDVLVEDLVIVELKSCEKITELHEAQLLTYLKLQRLPLGLIINFKVPLLKQGVKRMLLTTTPLK